MTLSFSRDSLIEFARPGPPASGPSSALRLRQVLADGLGPVAPHDPIVAYDVALQRARLERLEALYQQGGEATRERGLRHIRRSTPDIGHVFDSYAKRLPLEWQRWLWWAQWCYEQALPRDLPLLREAIEALIAVESQLQVDSGHPNRDHVIHQLADAEVAVKLHAASRPRFDDPDWDALCGSVPGLQAADRAAVTRAGLALAGMFHDVGYLRYVGAGARQALAAGFGIVAPAPTFDLWGAMETFAGGYLDVILSRDGTSDGLVADVFRYAWDRDWHGPLSAVVLSSAARRLQLDGRSTPRLRAALQLAAAAAFLHELHPVEPGELDVPASVCEARARIANFAWPALFRIVDELQCWGRPKLSPDETAPGCATIRYGANGAELDDGWLRVLVSAAGDAKREVKALEFLRDQLAGTSASDVFAALGVTKIEETVR